MKKLTITPQLMENLRNHRRERGWTRSRVAEEIQVDKGTYSNWERGVGRGIKYYHAERLANLYNTTPTKLTLPPERKIIPKETKDSLGNALDQLVTNWPSIKEESK